MKHTKKILTVFILLIFSLNFTYAGGKGGGGGGGPPCRGLLYDHPGYFDDGTCVVECGSPSICDRTKPGGKGGCLFGSVCNNNCICEWVDMDLDGYGNTISEYGSKDDCNDFNSNVHPGAVEICNNMDDDCDGYVDEGDVCKIDVFVCKTNNFDESSKSCSDGEWASGTTTTNMLSVSYHTFVGNLGDNNFYTYVCDAYDGDGDYGCYYFVGGEFSVIRTIICNNNGLLDEGEECDGSSLPSGIDCEDFGYSGGLMGCDNTCNFDFINCIGSVCNYNGIKDTGEECDGTDLNLRGCEDFGLRSAGLSCSDCQYDFGLCECSDWEGDCINFEDDIRTRWCPSSDGLNVVLEEEPCLVDYPCDPGQDDKDGDSYFVRNCWINELGIASEKNGLDYDDDPLDDSSQYTQEQIEIIDNDDDGNVAEHINPGAEEICDNRVDNNCDGSADVGCECNVGETMICGTNEGICKEGIQVCVGGTWGACGGTGYMGPAEEICGDGLDNNCDSYVDEGCFCIEGMVQECGSDVGICQKGNQT